MKNNQDITQDIKKILFTLKKNIKKKNPLVHLHEPFMKGKEKQYISNCINTNSVSSIGSYSLKFQNEIKKITKSKYVILTSSGTAALHLSLICAGVKKNDEILMPNLNYVASANSALYCGATPHLVDIRAEDLCIDSIKLEKYLKKILKVQKNFSINKKTKNIVRGLVCLHTFGHAAEIDKISKICKKFKIVLIEDAAESLGTFYKNRHVGNFGLMGILSFNGNKIITSGGGGAILTNNQRIAKLASHLSQISKKKHKYLYEYDGLGFNYRLPNINCALGYAQIKNIKKILKKKKNLYLKYYRMFKDINSIRLFKEPKNSKSNYWLQTIILQKPDLKIRNFILQKTNDIKISTRPVWQLLDEIKYLGKTPKMNLDVSKKLEKQIINLPSSPNL
jgi:perosamine synthetase